MRVSKWHVILWAVGAVSLVYLILGWLLSHSLLAGSGAVGLSYLVLQFASGNRRRRSRAGNASSRTAKPEVKRRLEPVDPNDTDALVEQMLAQGRYALLLRRQIACNLSDQQLQQAQEALADGMALVPDGEVALGQTAEVLDDGEPEDEEFAAPRGRVIRVERFFLDRYPVTNAQFYEFVLGGGYEQIALWDESIWPGVLEFVDATGEPGPRFWSQGCFEPGKDQHPVVGVSWYEAAAYARWLGKRLPTDAEWVKAGSWPVNLSATTRLQRKYPWGDTMDRTRANLWGSDPNGTVPVGQFPGGMSVGGVYELIGNVWEWTRGNFNAGDLPQCGLLLEMPLRSIRGAAYDTYFDNQATCQFPSGEAAVARKHNIGFRCAVGVCDLMLAPAGNRAAATAETETALAEEVQV